MVSSRLQHWAANSAEGGVARTRGRWRGVAEKETVLCVDWAGLLCLESWRLVGCCWCEGEPSTWDAVVVHLRYDVGLSLDGSGLPESGCHFIGSSGEDVICLVS